MEVVNLAQKLSLFSTHWDPKVVGELNGHHVKLVKLRGSFVWHRHEEEDELFLVVRGSLDMQLRGRTLRANEEEFVIVPRGTEHCPLAEEEAHVLLFEPASTVNTGDRPGERTVASPQRI